MSYSEPEIEPFRPGVAAEYQDGPFHNPDLFPLRPLTPPTSLPNPTLTTFYLFPNLPAELRIKIWHFLLPSPRIVKARPYAISERKRLVNKISHKKAEFLFNSSSLPPIPLFICKESREEALRFYKLSFGFDHPSLGSKIYFSGERDVLYFEFTDARFYTNLGYFTSTIYGKGCTRLDMDDVKRIAISYRLVIGRPNAIQKWARRLVLFRNLKEVIIAVERGEKGDKGPVGNDAYLEEVDLSDDEVGKLVKEVDLARVLWEGNDELGWKGRARKAGLENLEVPVLRVMEVFTRGERSEVILPVKERKRRLGSFGDLSDGNLNAEIWGSEFRTSVDGKLRFL